MRPDKVYKLNGNAVSEQAESSTANPSASTIALRTLIELQVISMLLREGLGLTDDLARMRQDVADSIS